MAAMAAVIYDAVVVAVENQSFCRKCRQSRQCRRCQAAFGPQDFFGGNFGNGKVGFFARSAKDKLFRKVEIVATVVKVAVVVTVLWRRQHKCCENRKCESGFCGN